MGTKHFLFGIAIAAIAIGCKPRKNDFIAAPANPVAGTGGRTDLRVIVKRYSKQIDTGTVYIKYNNTTTYTDTKYDDSGNIKVQNGKPMVIFDSLKAGNYYFYVRAKDLTELAPHDDLMGTGSFRIVDTTVQFHEVYINALNDIDMHYAPK